MHDVDGLTEGRHEAQPNRYQPGWQYRASAAQALAALHRRAPTARVDVDIGDPRVRVVTNMYPTAGGPAYGAFLATSQVRSLVRADRFGRCARQRGGERHGLLRGVAKGEFDVVHARHGLSGFVSAFQPFSLVVTVHGDDLLGTRDRLGGHTLTSRVVRRFSHAAAGPLAGRGELRRPYPEGLEAIMADVRSCLAD